MSEFTRTYTRFENTPVIVDGDKERNYIRDLPDTSQQPDDFFYDVMPHDRIDLLAYRFYGDPSLWWIIADFNDLRFPLVLPDTVLRLPSRERVFSEILE